MLTDSKNEKSEPVKDSVDDRYSVKVKRTNKDELYQPRCCEIELLPKLPTGIVVIGRSGSGKTQATVNLLTNKYLLSDTFDFIYLFTGVKPDKDLIADLKLPKENIKNNFTEEDVLKIMNKMEMTVEKQGMKNTPSVCFVFDDFLGEVAFLKSKTLTKLCTTNRHMNITYIILSQYYKKLPPVVRTNASYYMIFPSSASELDKISQELCPPSVTVKEFMNLAKHATKEKYQFLSINTKCDPKNQLRKNFNNIINTNS